MGSCCSMDIDFQFCKMRKFYRCIMQQCVIVNTTENCTFKN